MTGVFSNRGAKMAEIGRQKQLVSRGFGLIENLEMRTDFLRIRDLNWIRFNFSIYK